MSHSFVTIALPLPRGAAPKVRAALENIGNPIGETLDGTAPLPEGVALKQALDADADIHFIAAAIAPGAQDEADHLVIEASTDCPAQAVIDRLSGTDALGSAFAPAFAAAGLTADLSATLKAHTLKTGSGLRDLPGVDFPGTPGLSVERIREEAALSEGLRDHIGTEDAEPGNQTARARLDSLRATIKTHPRFSGLRHLAETGLPVPFLVDQKIRGLSAGLAFRLAVGASRHLLWPLLLVAALIALVRTLSIFWGIEQTVSLGWGSWALAAWSFLWRWVVWTIVLALIAWVFVMRTLARREKAESPDDSPPDPVRLAQVRQREDRQGLQNHLFGVSRMKSGGLRALLLRFAFWLIAFAAANAYRPGHLKDIGTIHFARWARIPGSRKLIFCSNYGGSWESYLEDFITKAPNGLTAVWSNTFGFPAARLLFGKGARDAAPFKRWARRQQHPTLMWYSAYPELTAGRIRINAAVRNGLVSAVTEDECRAVLALLGSRPAPEETLEKDEIQSIVLTGLSAHKQSIVSILELPEDPDKARDWLRDAIGRVGHGECPGDQRVDQIALTARGIQRLGHPRLMEDFPFVFKAGMESRAAALGDTGDDAPANWAWGQGEDSADVLLLTYLTDPLAPGTADALPGAEERAIYDRLAQICRRTEDDILRDIEACGGRRISSIVTLHLDDDRGRRDGAPHAREFFGFADGVSQPRIRGFRPYRLTEEQQHILAPGEFILGYPDNRGQRTAAARVPASCDPNHILPVAGADHGRAKQPDLARSGINEPRDFSRNGTFLVLRQLAQDVHAFNDTLKAAAKRFARHPGMPVALQGDPAVLDNLETAPLKDRIIAERRMHFIGAKMVGRWRNGSSLVNNPTRPAGGWDDALDPRKSPPERGDNGFLFGRDDPSGLACPYGSHVRRTNPRDSLNPEAEEQVNISNRHRILRRGRFFITDTDQSTEENGGRDEGLMFLCANADIERQFEFVQQTWMMAPQFHGLHNEVDPIFSRSPEHRRGVDKGDPAKPPPHDRYTIPTSQGPMVLTGIKDSIRVVGGGYFFLPSRAALCYLVNCDTDPST